VSRALGATVLGVDGFAVEVEVRISSQIPRIDVVGLPETAVRESAARVRAAVAAAGESFPSARVTVNLAPAALRKSGAGLDLPIALAVLAAGGAVEAEALRGRGWLGELALDGRLRPVRGALAMTLALGGAGCRHVVVPEANGAEAALAPDVEVRTARDLASLLASVRRAESAAPLPVAEPPPTAPSDVDGPCLSEVRGQAAARRALEVAAAGGHGLLLRGPPGAGKTMLARRLPGLLPPLERAEALETTRIHGAAGRLDERCPVLRQRPFRAPHHTASPAGLLGGGQPPRPGEVSLAHRGVLLLDELPEFDRRSLEALRQVLEERRVVLARAAFRCVLPAHFQLVAACNPCPCGWFRSGVRDCRCDAAAVERYARRVSGPLLDRIDMHVDVPPVRWRDLDARDAAAEDSASVRARVLAARGRQARRGAACNADLPDRRLDAAVDAEPAARALLGRAVDRLQLSARAARRLLRVARTVADLAGERRVGTAAVAEALTWRGLDTGSSSPVRRPMARGNTPPSVR